MTAREQIVKAHGLTPTQGRVLAYLHEDFSGRRLNLSYAMSAVTLLDRGLVSYQWEHDGRKTWFLTADGREVQQTINADVADVFTRRREEEAA